MCRNHPLFTYLFFNRNIFEFVKVCDRFFYVLIFLQSIIGKLTHHFVYSSKFVVYKQYVYTIVFIFQNIIKIRLITWKNKFFVNVHALLYTFLLNQIWTRSFAHQNIIRQYNNINLHATPFCFLQDSLFLSKL